MVRVYPTVNCDIATFNCKNLSITDPQRIIWIADTISTSNSDIVAIQEISHIEAINEIVTILGNEWNGVTELNPINTNRRVKEYMGFIYKKNKITLIATHTFTDNDLTAYIGSNKKLQKRSPVYARFIIEKTTDIVIINYHMDPANPIYDCVNINKNIKAIEKTNKINNIVILGDFNTDCNNCDAFRKIINKGWMPSLSSGIPTNYNEQHQYDNLWYNPTRIGLIKPTKVFRECIPLGSTIYTYTDHCLVMSKFAIICGLSKNANTFNPPDMSFVIRNRFKTLKRLCCNCCCNTKMICKFEVANN